MAGMPKRKPIFFTWFELILVWDGGRWCEVLSTPPTYISRWTVSSSLCFTSTTCCCDRFPVNLSHSFAIHIFICLFVQGKCFQRILKYSEVAGGWAESWIWVFYCDMLIDEVTYQVTAACRGRKIWSTIAHRECLEQVSFNLAATYCWTTP